MSDFSDDEDSSRVESRPKTPTGCARDDSVKEESTLCDRPIVDTVTAGDCRDSLDPNDTEYWTKFRRLTRQAFLLDGDSLSDSDFPDAVKEVVKRSRLTIMALNEYVEPPLEQRNDDGTSGGSDSEDTSSQCMSTDDDSEDDYFQYNNWHNGMKDNNCPLCSASGNGNDDNSDENSGPVGRAKSELTTTEAGIEIDSLGVDYAKYDEMPVTKRMLAGVLDTDEHLVTRVSMITAEVSQVDTSSYSNDSPGIQECVCPERGKRDDLSAHVDLQLWVKYGQRNMTDRCFGLCGISDRLNRPESDWCWDCVDRLVWGYLVSFLIAIVNANRSLGIDLFTEERRVYASGLGLVGDAVRPYDVICVYLRIKANFKGDVNKVMLRSKDPVDSRYHQWCVDIDDHEMGTCASVNREISVKGRFGCLYSPVHNADWLDGYPNRVGGLVITRTDATVAQYCSYMG